jgi:hypothetical protein
MIARIDQWLLRYQWYRNWQAQRSRKRLARQSIYAPTDDGEVESYTPTDLIAREDKRRETVNAERERREKDYV